MEIKLVLTIQLTNTTEQERFKINFFEKEKNHANYSTRPLSYILSSLSAPLSVEIRYIWLWLLFS